MMTGIPHSFYCVAMHLALHELPPGEAADLVQKALDDPGPENVRAVLKVGFGQPWCIRIEHALIELGVVASAQIRCPS